MAHIAIINAMYRCFLLPTKQLPPVTSDGLEFTIDVLYINKRYKRKSADMAALLNNYCDFIITTYNEFLIEQQNESNKLQSVGQ